MVPAATQTKTKLQSRVLHVVSRFFRGVRLGDEALSGNLTSLFCGQRPMGDSGLSNNTPESLVAATRDCVWTKSRAPSQALPRLGIRYWLPGPGAGAGGLHVSSGSSSRSRPAFNLTRMFSEIPYDWRNAAPNGNGSSSRRPRARLSRVLTASSTASRFSKLRI